MSQVLRGLSVPRDVVWVGVPGLPFGGRLREVFRVRYGRRFRPLPRPQSLSYWKGCSVAFPFQFVLCSNTLFAPPELPLSTGTSSSPPKETPVPCSGVHTGNVSGRTVVDVSGIVGFPGDGSGRSENLSVSPFLGVILPEVQTQRRSGHRHLYGCMVSILYNNVIIFVIHVTSVRLKDTMINVPLTYRRTCSGPPVNDPWDLHKSFCRKGSRWISTDWSFTRRWRTGWILMTWVCIE